MLIDLGIPVDMINWFEDDDRNYQYAPIDDESRETLNDLKRIRDSAKKFEDFEALKELKKDMRLIFEIGKEIWRLTRELGFAVAKEDYLRALELRNRLKKLRAKRDTFDALYETSRYEKMVNL
jgi:centrosomal protein CEP104